MNFIGIYLKKNKQPGRNIEKGNKSLQDNLARTKTMSEQSRESKSKINFVKTVNGFETEIKGLKIERGNRIILESV